jgi:hypothetical protein
MQVQRSPARRLIQWSVVKPQQSCSSSSSSSSKCRLQLMHHLLF